LRLAGQDKLAACRGASPQSGGAASVVVLLAGGDKRTQARNIALARALAGNL
jgi:hypothetical protein